MEPGEDLLSRLGMTSVNSGDGWNKGDFAQLQMLLDFKCQFLILALFL
jgi:hypothetical protein